MTPLPDTENEVHETHCCPTHGCKYGDPDCPVVIGKTTKRSEHCGWCELEAKNTKTPTVLKETRPISCNRTEARNLITSGADVYMSHHCGDYYEFLQMTSASICGDSVCIFTTYPSASKLYNPNGDNYIIHHAHTIDNTLMLARTNFLLRSGKCGGMFGLPNCSITRNWPRTDHRWVLRDSWHPCKRSILEAIRSCEPVKASITTDAFTAITPCGFITQHDNGVTCIRTSSVAMERCGGFDLIDFEICGNTLYQKTHKIRETPKRFSMDWFAQRIQGSWEVDYSKTTDFKFELLSRKPNGACFEWAGM